MMNNVLGVHLHRLLSALALALVAGAGRAQVASVPTFDAVSIRPTTSERIVEINHTKASLPASWMPCEYLPGRVRCTMPLEGFVREAFQVREFQIVLPAWMKHDMFHLEAVMLSSTSVSDAKSMLKQAIVSAFNLKYSRESRSTDVFAMVATDDGPRLGAYDADKPKNVSLDTPGGRLTYNYIAKPGEYFANGTSLDIFAHNLEKFAGLDRPVVNKTGLTGRYTIDLKWKSSADADNPLNLEDKGIVRAMEQQIGLKLVKASENLDYLIIDSADKTPHEI